MKSVLDIDDLLQDEKLRALVPARMCGEKFISDGDPFCTICDDTRVIASVSECPECKTNDKESTQ